MGACVTTISISSNASTRGMVEIFNTLVAQAPRSLNSLLLPVLFNFENSKLIPASQVKFRRSNKMQLVHMWGSLGVNQEP